MLSMVIFFYKQREQRKDALRSYAEVTILAIIFVFKGFVKLKKIKKITKKSWKWVGGSSPNSDFYFFGRFCVFCVVFMFPNVPKKNLDWWVGG